MHNSIGPLFVKGIKIYLNMVGSRFAYIANVWFNIKLLSEIKSRLQALFVAIIFELPIYILSLIF